MLGALILALVAIVPASADKPIHEIGVYEGDWNSDKCGEQIPTHLEGKYVRNYFFDRDGGDRADTWHLEETLT